MTHADYTVIADTIADCGPALEMDPLSIGMHFAKAFEVRSQTFDRRRFMQRIIDRIHEPSS